MPESRSPQINADKQKPAAKVRLPAGIWALGFVSLLMDVSSEIVHGLLPVFLVTVLGANFTTVGMIEGVGEALALAVKVFSGALSDRLGKRKPLVALGYAMGALSKPVFALAQSPGLVFGARMFDRTGKGIRGAPRDALVADIAPELIRGEAFGLRQSMDTIGAFLGPILAIVLMAMTGDNYRLVFWLAVIPGLLAVLVVLFGVQEPESREASSSSAGAKKIFFARVRELGAAFWIVSVLGALFQLARISEAFLILRGENFGLGLKFAPTVLIVMNIVYAVSAYPLGWLSDRWPRERLVGIGFVLLAASEAVLAWSTHLSHFIFGIVLWGLHLGFTQGTLAALVADTCPKEDRGTAFGVFNLLSALALFIGNPVAGILWDHAGPRATFMAGTGVALLSGLAFVVIRLVVGRGVRNPTLK